MPPKRRKRAAPAAKGPCKDCGSTTRPRTYPGPRCATCYRVFKKKSKTRSRDSYLQRTYGISQEDYDAVKQFQNGKCFICQRATGASKNLAVDHDHRHCSGRTGCRECVRGLLCSSCNQGVLGHLRDDVEALQRAIDYLTDPPARKVLGNE